MREKGGILRLGGAGGGALVWGRRARGCGRRGPRGGWEVGREKRPGGRGGGGGGWCGVGGAAGARMVAYSMKDPGRLAGPLEGHGPLADGQIWLRSLEGERTRVEVYFPGLRPGQTPAEKPFVIDRLQHLYRDPIAMQAGGGVD